FALSSCLPTNQETTLFTSIGENVEVNMCVISESPVEKENFGFNNITSANSLKYYVDIKHDENQHNISLTIRNVTRDDIKFYVFRIRDNVKQTAVYVVHLKLTE
ncbi:hypothetical protein Bpfe_026267, partial [Biomphalaria pfeifferi]